MMSEKTQVPMNEALKATVVTSDAGVVEGIFLSYEDALYWARNHRMDIHNLREGYVTERDGMTKVKNPYGA
jgi:hypothetical protein